MRYFTFTFIFSLFFLFGMAQYPNTGRIDLVTVGGGVGFASFFGDLGAKGEVSSLSNIREVYYVNLERRFGSVLGFQLDGSLGKLSYNEHSKDTLLNRNFESKTMQVGLNVILHFDNDIIIKRKTPFAPYLSAGFQYFKFDSYTDLKDKNGNTYYYWSDGTINDVPQWDKDAPNAKPLYRDYVYETKLKDSAVNYAHNSFIVPLTVGLKWKLTPRFNARFFGTYNLIFTDWIDNIDDGKNDYSINVGMGLHYVLKARTKELKHRFDEVDFVAIDNMDSDKDGIKDDVDKCQGTMRGVEVDKHGCPLDKDKDGIPDYVDVEEDTPKGSVVDEYGRALTQELIEERRRERMALFTERHTTFSENSSQATLEKIFDEIKEKHVKGGSIPAHLKEVDTDGDGLISPKEVSDTLDGFFAGTNNFTVHAIHDLIDYFFEQ